MQNDSIWVIDSDLDDQDLVRQIWRELELANDLVILGSADEAITHLQFVESAPFIIICELNLPMKNGFELREELLSKNSKKFKSVPFILWATQASEEQITHAYELSVHGFFIKETIFDELKRTFTDIINYWMRSKMPAKNGS